MTLTKNRTLLWIVSLAALVGGLYVYFWQFAFNSDYAMIGLLAKHILTTGQQFIFVPQVGYQGLLYEANLVALMFKLFGISPVTIQFAPFLTYMGFCLVFYFAVRAWYDSAIAAIATIFVIVSCPEFYGQVLRTQPNYGETFLMGSALLWMYRKLLDGPNPKLAGLFGLVMGFAVYTYGQIFYFIAAIGFHLLLCSISIDHSYWGKAVKRILVGMVAYFSLALVWFFGSVSKLSWNGKVFIKFDPYGILQSAVAIAIVTILLFSFRRHQKVLRKWIPSAVALGAAALVGVSPKIYFHLIQKGVSLSKLGRSSSLPEMVERLGYFGFGNARFFNFSSDHLLSWVALAAGISFLAGFFWFSFRGFWETLKPSSPSRKAAKKLGFDQIKLQFTPFFTLWIAIVAIYMSASVVRDVESIRYIVVLILPYSVALAYVFTWAFRSTQNFRHPKLVTLLASAGILCLLIVNANSLGQSLVKSDKTTAEAPVIDYLREHHIKYGFGDYWYSYIITFLTNESIVIEPIVTNYIPYYLDMVSPQQRVAYLDFKPYKTGDLEISVGQTLSIYGGHYQVKEQAHVGKIDIFTLEKLL